MSNYTLSIILPIYNVKDYLERCVESIEVQSFKDYEVILVDDGSTDGSGDLVEKLAKRFINSRVVHKVNGGLSSARNAGLEVATGQYVFMIDSDDWIEANAFETIVNCIKDNPDIIKFNLIRRPDGNKVYSTAKPGYYDKKAIEEELIRDAIEDTGNFIFSAWSHVYKLDFLNKKSLRFVSEREIGSEDYLFNTQTYLEADSIIIIKDAIYDYDCRDGSLTQKYRKNLFSQYIKLHSLMQNAVNKCKKDDVFSESIVYSFVEKMIGVCIQNECLRTKEHSLFIGWINTHKMVSSREYKNAMKLYPYDKGRKSRKLLLPMMRVHIVLPTMYLLMR